ncbi:tape measure protein [Sporosarcina sp. FSL K6-2383]|uniref:tape measure protein n=1 Tax=Sporosarcina sp. FSL K6-2383 TaxID=2921556 RepID=UPI00315AB2B5
MANDGQISIGVEVDGRQVTAASTSLDRMASSARSVGGQTEAMGQQTARASMSIKDLAMSLGLVEIASAALKTLKASLDGAISRFDTLRGFPVVMERMGFSSEQAHDSISKLSAGIQGLPTTLDGIVASTQRIAVLTGDLDTATDTALSLNNAFLASGASASDAERGLTQYVQMLSKGSVDIMSWRTLQETMGYALKETAAEFGFTGRSAQNDLYDALKGGEIVFDEFNAKLIELNEGVGGFADMAATGSAGIKTSFGNLKNAVVVGVANIVTSFDNLSQATTGKTIAQNLDGLKVVVGSAFKVIGKVIEGAVPVVIAFAGAVDSAIPVVKALSPAIIGLVAAFAAYTVYSKASAAISAAKIAIDAARATTLTLTIATNARVASQVVANTTDRTGAAITVAQTSAITLKTFALGVMTGAIKLSTAAQIIAATATSAWGAAIKLFAGPIGWVTLAVGALVTGIIAMVKWFKKSSEEGERLNKQNEELASSTDTLNSAVKDSTKAYEKQQEKLTTNAEVYAESIAKIEELAAIEKLSGEQKKELNSYIDQLNKNVTGMNLVYGEESKALSMTSEQMLNRINLMKEEEKLQVAQTRMTEIMKEQNEVQKQLVEVNALREEWNQKLADGTVKSGEHKTALEELEAQENALKEAGKVAGDARVEVDNQIIESSAAVAAATEQDTGRQAKMFDELKDHQKEAVEGMKSSWDDYASSATDMFDTLSEKSKVSVGDMTKNLEENQRIIGEWADNVATLAERGIDEGLLDTLRSAGPEAAGLVNNLVSSSDAELAKLSEAFANGGDVATQALVKSMGIEDSGVMGAVGHLVVDTEQALSQAIQSADFGALGQAVPEGTVKGIESGTKDVAEAAEKMAGETEKAFKGALDINSPSGVFEKFGINITEGADKGIKNGTPPIILTMQNLVKSMKDQFKDIYSDFVKIGNDTTAGLNQGLIAGQVKVMATARGLANNVAATMRKELDIHSPSRVTTKIGSQTGAGFLKGLKGAEKEIEKASKKSAKAAVSGTKTAIGEAKKAGQAAAARYKEALDVSKYKFKMGEIDSAAYIVSLEKVRKAYAKTPEQVRKVNLEIANVQKASAKAEQQVIKDSYEHSKNFIEKRKRDGEISLSAELNAWLRVQDRYKAGTKERIDAEKNVAKVRIELAKAEFDAAKDAIDTRKYYNQLSLTEELAAWEKIQAKYLDGTKEREEADRNVYRVKKEINDQLIALNESYSKKMSDISKKLVADELKVNEDLAKGIASIKDNANKEILKAEENLASKTKDINEKLLADQQREMDNYLKSVEEGYNRLNNFNGGLFNYFEMLPAESGDDLTTILESQLNGLKEWEKQMEELSGKAIDEGLLEELRKMGPEALPELMAFNNMTEDQLETYSAIYQEKSAKARELAEKENEGLKADTEKRLQEMRAIANAELSQLQYDTQIHISAMRQAADMEIAQMQVDAHMRINEMRVTANEELEVLKDEWVKSVESIKKATDDELKGLKEIGRNAGKGLMDGLSSMEGALVAKATSIANAVKAAMASALDINSPSRWMRDYIAGNMALGFIDGVDANQSKVVNAADRFAEFMKPKMVDVIVPNVNFKTFNPNFAGGQGVSSSNDNRKSYSHQITNHFTPAQSTPSEHARQQSRMLVELGMHL